MYLAVQPTDKVLEEEIFFLDLFSGASDGQGFGRRRVFFWIYLVVRPTDKVLEEEVFLHLFSGATDGQGFGRRSFFAFI